jgi:hypothetical protein
MKLGVGMRVRETADCRNNFKTWKERRGMVTVFSLQLWRSHGAVKSVRGSPEPKSFGCIVLSAIVFVRPSCRDFSDKQRIQTLNHRTQKSPF